ETRCSARHVWRDPRRCGKAREGGARRCRWSGGGGQDGAQGSHGGASEDSLRAGTRETHAHPAPVRAGRCTRRRGPQGPAARSVDVTRSQGIPMKAFVLERYGKGRGLRPTEVPTPELRDDEVLVEVHAAGVNLLDSKIRNGEFKLILPYRMPLVLGHDVAGVVVKVGPRVRQFKPGDEVYARPDDFRIGTFAQFVPVREASLAL